MSEFKSIPSNLFAGKSSIISAIFGSMCSSIGNNAFKECISFEKINDDNVIEEIAYGAFYSTKLSSAIFSTLTKINETKDVQHNIGAFENCRNLTNINIKNCLNIPSRTFSNCTTLSSIDATSCQSVGNSAFFACQSLSEIDLKSCTNIGAGAFSHCYNLSSINATSCKSIGSLAFYACRSLSEIDLKSCNNIEDSAFMYCINLTSINFDNKCIIGSSAFSGLTKLKNVPFSKCKTIDGYAFSGCTNIENVNLYNCRIGVGTFKDCENLKELTIKDGYIGNSSLLGIGNSAFLNCKNLQTVNIISTDPNSDPILIGSSVFYSGNSIIENIRFYLSTEQIEKYKVSSNWSEYASNMHVLASENQIIYTTSNNEIISISDDTIDDLGISNHTYNEDYGIIEFDTDNKYKILNKQLFKDNKNLTSIQIPPCCIEIGESEFSGCTSLNSVMMPISNPKLEKIGKYAFENCGQLKSFTIPDTITEIGEGAFRGCTGIESFKGNEKFVKYNNKAIISNDTLICFLPKNNSKFCNISDIDNNIKILGEYCFQNCNKLIKVNIPSTIQSIHQFVFDNCTNIIEVNFNSFIPPLIEETSFGVWVYDNSNNKYTQSDTYNFNLLHLFIPENTFESYFKQYREDDYWFCNNFYIKPNENHIVYYEGIKDYNDYGEEVIEVNNTKYNIININGNTVPSNLYKNINIEKENVGKIIIGENFTKIDKYAFKNFNNLIYIYIPDTISEFGDECFYGCENIEQIYIPNREIEINETENIVEIIDEIDLNNTNTIIKGNTIFGNEIFVGCKKLRKFISYYGNFVSNDGRCYIDGNKLMFFITYNLGAYCEQAGAYKLPDRITEINRSAFRGSIKYGENDYLTIKLNLNKTEKIGEYAFCDCDMSNLTNEIKLGDNINNISPYAFKDCKKLTTIKIPDKLDIIDKGLFEGCEKLGSITPVEIPDNIITINENAFKGCTGLTSITTKSPKLEYIKYGAFEGCVGLKSFEIPETIIELGDYAFKNCTSYELDFTISSNLSEIGNYCFENSGIKKILSNNNQNLKSIKEGAFKNCKSLNSVDISKCSNIKIIRKCAFNESNCSNVKLPNIINIIENSAFEGCRKLSKFDLPSELTKLGHSCLLTNTNTQINIPIALKTPPSFINTSSNSKYATKFPFGDPRTCIIDICISNFNLANTYKANLNWKQYSSRIFIISMNNIFADDVMKPGIDDDVMKPGIDDGGMKPGGGTIER